MTEVEFEVVSDDLRDNLNTKWADVVSALKEGKTLRVSLKPIDLGRLRAGLRQRHLLLRQRKQDDGNTIIWAVEKGGSDA